MPIQKELILFVASQSVAAAATVTGAWIDLRAKYGVTLVANILNGATGPTAPCQFRVEYSGDGGTTFDEIIRVPGTTLANGDVSFRHRIEPEVLFARVIFTGNTAQPVTVKADGHVVKTIG